MSAEERAKAIVTAWDENDYGPIPDGDTLDRIIIQDLTAAIKAAENDALERAAKGLPGIEGICRTDAYLAQKYLRSFKHTTPSA